MTGNSESLAYAVELFTAPGCPHCDAAREDLEWRGVSYVEYDVEYDAGAMARLMECTGGRTVPVILEAGSPPQVGWQGRGCTV